MQPYKYLHWQMEAGLSTLGEDYVEVLAEYVMAIVGNVMEEEQGGLGTQFTGSRPTVW